MKIDVRQDVIPKLRKVKENGNGWIACCPAHDDKNPSLSIKEGNGKVLFNCFAGCKYVQIIDALGLNGNNQRTYTIQHNVANPYKRIVDQYDYTDENGKLIYQVVRYEPKEFKPRKPDGKDGWIWNIQEVKRVPYHLSEIIDAREKNLPVIICEGEKDVNNVREKLRFVATTTALGSNSWNNEYAKFFDGLDIIILPDNDESGMKYAINVANSLHHQTQSLKVVNLPNLSEKEDVTDWIEKGGTREQLLDIIANVQEWNSNDSKLVKYQDSSLEENTIDAIFADYLTEAHLTDAGNAECFQLEYGDKFKFNKTNSVWHVWNNVIWQEDRTSTIDNVILKTIRNRQIAALDFPDNKPFAEKAKALNYLLKCEDTRNRKNMKEAVEMLPHFITTIEQYDKDLYLVATKNGTLDLRNGSFRQSKQEDYLTLQFGTEYNAAADCPRWKKFLQEIFSDDEEMIDFIQRVAGYCLTGSITEQVMFILYGYGKNGKTVFQSVLGALLGDYAGTASFKTFDADKQNEQTNDLAILKGRRFVSMSESAADRKLNEPLIKQVTGGDEITCRFLRKEFFSYVPQFKLFLATNHKPIITQSDFGIWRRIVLIPFTQNFDGREEAGLREQLLSELPGILNWAIEGLKKWHNEGLKKHPRSVTEATEKYKKDSDTIGRWLECNMDKHPASEIKSSEAYNNYKDWSSENGHYSVGNKTFKSSLEERGFQLVERNKGNFWIGFGLPFALEPVWNSKMIKNE